MQNPEPTTRNVVTANLNMEIGRKISESDIVTKEWPINIIPENSFSDTSLVIGRVVRTEFFKGEAILNTKLAPEGSEGGFASVIRPRRESP